MKTRNLIFTICCVLFAMTSCQKEELQNIISDETGEISALRGANIAIEPPDYDIDDFGDTDPDCDEEVGAPFFLNYGEGLTTTGTLTNIYEVDLVENPNFDYPENIDPDYQDFQVTAGDYFYDLGNSIFVVTDNNITNPNIGSGTEGITSFPLNEYTVDPLITRGDQATEIQEVQVTHATSLNGPIPLSVDPLPVDMSIHAPYNTTTSYGPSIEFPLNGNNNLVLTMYIPYTHIPTNEQYTLVWEFCLIGSHFYNCDGVFNGENEGHFEMIEVSTCSDGPGTAFQVIVPGFNSDNSPCMGPPCS